MGGSGLRVAIKLKGEKDYSIFDSGVYRIHAAEWLFLQEKAIFHAFLM
jgi:hypothetical protein